MSVREPARDCDEQRSGTQRRRAITRGRTTEACFSLAMPSQLTPQQIETRIRHQHADLMVRWCTASAAFALHGHKTTTVTNKRAAAATSHHESEARMVRSSAFMRAAKPYKSRFAEAATASHPKTETRIKHQHTELRVSWCIGGCLGSTRGATTLLQV